MRYRHKYTQILFASYPPLMCDWIYGVCSILTIIRIIVYKWVNMGQCTETTDEYLHTATTIIVNMLELAMVHPIPIPIERRNGSLWFYFTHIGHGVNSLKCLPERRLVQFCRHISHVLMLLSVCYAHESIIIVVVCNNPLALIRGDVIEQFSICSIIHNRHGRFYMFCIIWLKICNLICFFFVCPILYSLDNIFGIY